jgi:hypothetical protein
MRTTADAMTDHLDSSLTRFSDLIETSFQGDGDLPRARETGRTIVSMRETLRRRRQHRLCRLVRAEIEDLAVSEKQKVLVAANKCRKATSRDGLRRYK